MPRPLRVGAAGAAALAATALLSGCTKPPPKVTALGGGTVVTISPSTYCYDPQHCANAAHVDLPRLTVAADAKVLLEVPQGVLRRGWQARALSLDGKQLLGSSGPIADSHSYKVPSGVAGGNAFILQVNELDHGQPDGSTWSLLVKISPTKS